MNSTKLIPKKKKSISVNPITIENETTKLDKVDMDRNCEFSLRKIPISQARIEQIKDALRGWIEENPEAKSISKFYYAMGISAKTYYRFIEKDPEFAELHEMTMRKIGERMYENSVDCKANWNAVKFRLHQYAPEFKEAKEYEAQLNRRDDVTDKGPVFIVMDKFPDSDLVKERNTQHVKD